MLAKIITKINSGINLTENESYECLKNIFTGEYSNELIKNLLAGLADKGETVDEIVGFARAMRESALKVKLEKEAFDVCGTGGTGKDRFNVSTASTFILAAAGVPIAKHGNRGSKKPNGSFDFLEALDIKFETNSLEFIQEMFNQTNLCFLFARNHHPAVKYVVPARKELKTRTIFNFLGPLCNPAFVPYQIIGTISEEIAQKLAKVLQRLNTRRALVIVGLDGTDELTTASESLVYDVHPDKIETIYFNPDSLKIKCTTADISGSDAKDNAELFKSLFKAGNIDHNISKLICLNAGAALFCCNQAPSIEAGFKLAIQHLQDKSAWKKYLQYRDLAKQIFSA